MCICAPVRAGPGALRASGRSAPVIGAIRLPARPTPTPPSAPVLRPPTPPPPLPPPPPPPPPPTLRLTEAALMPPLVPGVLLANKERAEGRPTSSAATRPASPPRRTPTVSPPTPPTPSPYARTPPPPPFT